jgi:SAM-dependent methyltransferase
MESDHFRAKVDLGSLNTFVCSLIDIQIRYGIAVKNSLLKYLCCPDCSGDLQLHDTESEGNEIMKGALACVACDRRFAIERGIPRFANLTEVAADKKATAENFGWSWQEFSHENEVYDEQFLGWISPVKPDFFKDKVVLEGGCGKGRHTRRAAKWGVRDVVAVDLSEAVEVAFASTRELENAHVIQADIYRLPLRQVFDYAFSVGVLHHLPDPRAGFRSLVSRVKPGGHASAWVYGAENNGWITSVINPLRVHFTSRISPRALLHLSKLPTAMLYAATKLIYGPLSRIGDGNTARRLFYGDYLVTLSSLGWREQHCIVFDHLVAPTAFYLTRAEFAAWWSDVNATDVEINWHNKNSWCGFGRVQNLSAPDAAAR